MWGTRCDPFRMIRFGKNWQALARLTRELPPATGRGRLAFRAHSVKSRFCEAGDGRYRPITRRAIKQEEHCLRLTLMLGRNNPFRIVRCSWFALPPRPTGGATPGQITLSIRRPVPTPRAHEGRRAAGRSSIPLSVKARRTIRIRGHSESGVIPEHLSRQASIPAETRPPDGPLGRGPHRALPTLPGS
jgi:hypothetical protein